MWAPRHRPSWWTPDAVLTRLQAGETPLEICRTAAKETDGRCSPTTLRSDISQWTHSATWGDQYQAALALFKTTRGGQVEISDTWYDDFFDAMSRCDGRVEDACVEAGVDAGLVYALLDRRNDFYDKQFSQRFRVAEGQRLARIRANVMQQAEMSDPDGAKLGVKVLESNMPALHAPRQQVAVEGKVDVEHTHVVMLSPEVVAAAQQRLRTLFAGRVPHSALSSGVHASVQPPNSQSTVIDVPSRVVSKGANDASQ